MRYFSYIDAGIIAGENGGVGDSYVSSQGGSLAVGVGAALGGVLGALIASAISSGSDSAKGVDSISAQTRGRLSPSDYRFSHGGIVSLALGE